MLDVRLRHLRLAGRRVSDDDLRELLEQGQHGPRVLCLDLERIPGSYTRDIWEGRDAKRVNYVHPSTWTSLPFVVCGAYRWLGDPIKDTGFIATWQSDDPGHVGRRLWDLYDEADVILGFNQKAADTPWAKQTWTKQAGIRKRPSPHKDIDLYLLLRRDLKLPSASLDFACQWFDIPGKRGKYNADEAKAAHAGDVRMQARLERYNKGDVTATIRLWEESRGLLHLPGLNLGLYYGDESWRCSNCGHNALDVDKWRATTQTRYAGYRCRKCGTPLRSNNRKHSTTIRSAT